MTPDRELTHRKIFAFWIPLAATWLMIAAEGPFLAAVIARLADPKYNLAAYGVALSFALIIEAPVIMMLSASTALVEGRRSFLKLRNFTYGLNATLTATLLLLVLTPAFDFIVGPLMKLPDDVARLTHTSLLLFLPWPGAIGYRRFYQGLLIRHNRTRLVAYGTIVRFSTIALTAFVLYRGFALTGAYVGAASLAAGVTLEASATGLMARGVVRDILKREEPSAVPLSYGQIIDFYTPLALTSVISLAVHPMVTFFLGQGRMPLESLAVWPVVNAVSFVFRSVGLSYQEVVIALLGNERENYIKLRNFGLVLMLLSSLGLGVLAFTDFSRIALGDVGGLSHDLADFAKLPLEILTPLPALTILLAVQRALMVHSRRTRPVTWATVVEILSTVLLLSLTIGSWHLPGAGAGALSLLLGRLAGNLSLVGPCWRVLHVLN